MSERKPFNADELAKTKKPGDVQLTEEELSKASGGEIQGESEDKDHKND